MDLSRKVCFSVFPCNFSLICTSCCSDLTVSCSSHPIPHQFTYCGFGDSSHWHSESQQGVVLILRQSEQLGDALESLGGSVPVQTGSGLTERHIKWRQGFRFFVHKITPHQTCVFNIQNCAVISREWNDFYPLSSERGMIGPNSLCSMTMTPKTKKTMLVATDGLIWLMCWTQSGVTQRNRRHWDQSLDSPRCSKMLGSTHLPSFFLASYEANCISLSQCCIFTKQTKQSGKQCWWKSQKMFCRVQGRRNSHRENAEQLLSVGDVRYCRLCAVQEVQEDVASMGSVSVNLLCRLLSQAAHCPTHTAHRMA